MHASQLAVHCLGGDGPPTLYAHATGFHARCWSPVVAVLPGLHNVGYDARGHGDTPIGGGWPNPDIIDWSVYGNDAALVAHSQSVNGRVLGVGHSMGGAAMLMAALAAPELFCGLVIYEPVVMPPNRAHRTAPNILATGARRRRATFESLETALANYAAKPPMDIFTPQSLEAYVRFGFRAESDGKVHLKCTPEHEARTYEAGGNHHTWERLGDITVPVWVLSGRSEPGRPSDSAAALAAQIPGGRYTELDHLGHFGPMQAPDEIAALIGEAAMAFHGRIGDPFRP